MMKGFTLLELSIVLVIIGLIAGGITVGAEMIRSAELRAVITDIHQYKTAIHTFKDKYFQMPGDMTNATAFWGTDSSGCPSGGGATGTCNGDGDNAVRNASPAHEHLRFWQQLALSGLIEGSYTGALIGGTTLVPGENIPTAPMSGGGYIFRRHGTYGLLFQGIQLGSLDSLYNTRFWGPIIAPTDAYNIDKKIDDGVPWTGNVIGNNGSSAGTAYDCIDDETTTPNNYVLSSTTALCRMWFIYN